MRLIRRLQYLMGRRQAEIDLAEEMASHQAMHQLDLENGGVAARDAARWARRGFGSRALTVNRVHDVWVWPWLQDVAGDFRFALRLLAKDRGFTAVMVLVLGLGIGVAHLQFVLIDAICIRGLPIPGVDRVLFLGARDSNGRDLQVSYQEFEHLRAGRLGTSALAAFASAPGVLGDEGRAPDRVLVTYASAPLFRVLAEQPLIGRDFDASDDVQGAVPVAILTTAIWRARYGADSSIVGRVIRVNGTPTTVIGVMREPLRFPNVADVWCPLTAMPGLVGDRRAARALGVVARLADAASVTGVRASLATVSAELARIDPTGNAGITLTVQPINDRYNGRLTDGVWIAFGGVAVVVLLIACFNAANLLLVRAAKRGHEIAVRASIGASRARIVRQLFVESTVLAVASGGAAALVSAAGLYFINAVIPENTLAYWMKYEIDARALAALLTICLGTVFVFGLAPAVHVARTDVHTLMRAGGRAGFGALRGRRWMLVFMSLQCGLTMVMLNAIVVGVRTAREAGRRFVAVDTANVLTTWVTLPADRYRTPESRRAFYDAAGERIAALNGVSTHALATALPLGGAAAKALHLEGQFPIPNQAAATVWTITVSERYFDSIGVGLVRGREFDRRDGLIGREAVIVNQRFADRFLSGRDPIGRRLQLSDPGAPASSPMMTVVGISPNIRQRSQSAEVDPVVYLPLTAAPPVSSVLLLRGDPSVVSLAPALRESIRAVDPELPLYRTLPMEQALDASNWNGRVSEALLNSIAFVAICLAGIGLYAVMAHAVVHRTREIGLRVALGARRSQLVAMMARSATVYLTLGVLAGSGCVMVFAWLIERGAGSGSAPFRLNDPLTFGGGILLLTLITAAAAIVPTWRAIRIEPARVLREG